MDLVKSHLMYAVREEVEVLKEQIKELFERNSVLERENAVLKSLANNEQLSQLPVQSSSSSISIAPVPAQAQPQLQMDSTQSADPPPPQTQPTVTSTWSLCRNPSRLLGPRSPPHPSWRNCEESYFFNKENPAMKRVYFLASQFSESIFKAIALHPISIHQSVTHYYLLQGCYFQRGTMSTEPFNLTATGHQIKQRSD